MSTVSVARDSWVEGPGGWKLQHITTLREIVTLDGKVLLSKGWAAAHARVIIHYWFNAYSVISRSGAQEIYMDEPPVGVDGAEKLLNLFGYWPSFHDAEVLSFRLERSGSEDLPGPTAECSIHVFEITREVTSGGYLVLKNHTLVTFRFVEVVQLRLDDFNHQNTLWELEIINIADRQLERIKFEVHFKASSGMGAEFQCCAIEIMDVQPYTLPGAVF